MTKLDRRDLIGAALLLGSTAHIASAQAASVGAAAPRDAQYWRSVADQYDITREIVPFEIGMWVMMPRPVLEQTGSLR